MKCTGTVKTTVQLCEDQYRSVQWSGWVSGVVCTVLLLQSVSYILQRHLFIFVVTPSPTLADTSIRILKK